MRRLLIHRFGWIEEADFFELFAACNLIPGPSSTELAIFLGYKRAGKAGLLLAGVCFILPATLIMIGLAALYQRYGTTLPATHLLKGITAVVVGILAWAVLDIGRRVLGDGWKWIVCLAVVAAALIGVTPILLLAAGGVLLWSRLSMSENFRHNKNRRAPLYFIPFVGALSVLKGKLAILGWTFLKIGFVAFGSGYVLLVLLRSEVVLNLHWLTERQLVDAVAISQATPGPVFTTATFIGYLVSGIPGALLATLAIFAPAFIFVPPLERIVGFVRKHPSLREVLAGVNVAALGLIVAVSLEVAKSAVVSPGTAVIAALTFFLLLREPLAAPLAIVGGGLAGLLAPAIL